MKIVKLPLLDRARKYGYIIWRKQNDFEMKLLLGETDEIKIVIDGSSMGVKNIDWKNRRIPITYTVTRALSKTVSKVSLRLDSKKRLCVSFS